jgi:molybdopterin-guanine dinucleotide biosynthesis protein
VAGRVFVRAFAFQNVGDGLEAAVRMLRETGHDVAVVHAPPVDPREVGTDLAAVERCSRAELVVARGIRVVVVHAEEERVDRRPLEPEGEALQHDVVSHHATVCRAS